MSIPFQLEMLSKISSFFKPPSASTPISHNDELAIWENRQHHIFTTYRRTRTCSNPNSVVLCSKAEELTKTGTAVVKNKKWSYAQFDLDFGQFGFLLYTCSAGGIKFTPGDADDEKLHKDFHESYPHGIQFRGWASERVVPVPSVKGG